MRTERPLVAEIENFPVYVPTGADITEDSPTLAHASLAEGVLRIEFKNTLTGVAIQRMLDRGELLGLTFVLMPAVQEVGQDDAENSTEEIKSPTENEIKE